MNNSYIPIVITVFGAVLYHIAQKSIPKTANPLFALIIAYLAAILICLTFNYFFPNEKGFIATLKESNWAIYGVGLGAACIEIGVLFAYRAGWQLSIMALLTTILISVLLLPVGLIFFKEHLTNWNYLGVVLCLGGLFLISLK